MASRGASITATGIRKAYERLEAVGDAALDQTKTMDDLAAEAPAAITKVPKDTGRLERSLQDGAAEQFKRVFDDGYAIGTTVYYSRFVPKPRVARKRLADQAAVVLAKEIGRAE